MKRLFIIPLLLISICLSAAPIGEKRAREIAADFFKSASTRTAQPALNLEWAGDDFDAKVATRAAVNTDEALIYIYNRTDVKGYVIIAGDSNVEQAIVAFSYEKNFDVNNIPDGAKYLLSGWCRQIADARAKVIPISRTSTRADVGIIEKDYNTAEWNQSEPFNNEAPIINGGRSVTGCVATAMAIICYHNKWPDCGVGTTPEYSFVDANGAQYTIPANELGRTYQYDLMRSDNYQNGYTSSEGAAVAALMKDMGTSVKMQYSPSASGAFSTDVPNALYLHFKYSSKAQCINRYGYSYDEWVSMLRTNLDKYGPTYLSGASNTGGHAFVADGYATGGYFGINFGWGGAANGFYLLPNIGYVNGLDGIFYLEPDKSGVSKPKSCLELITLSAGDTTFRGIYETTFQYSVGVPFNMHIAGIYNSGYESFNGVLRINLCDSKGTVKEALYERAVTIEPYNTTGYFWYDLNIPSLIITKEIEYGDRIRIYAKDAGASEWTWVRSSSATGMNTEIIIKDVPDEIARSLAIDYVKDYKYLYFLPAQPVVATLYDSANVEKTSVGARANEIVKMDLSSCGAGEYRIEFKRGGEPYVLTLVF